MCRIGCYSAERKNKKKIKCFIFTEQNKISVQIKIWQQVTQTLRHYSDPQDPDVMHRQERNQITDIPKTTKWFLKTTFSKQFTRTVKLLQRLNKSVHLLVLQLMGLSTSPAIHTATQVVCSYPEIWPMGVFPKTREQSATSALDVAKSFTLHL